MIKIRRKPDIVLNSEQIATAMMIPTYQKQKWTRVKGNLPLRNIGAKKKTY
jgi:hypothetical protein